MDTKRKAIFLADKVKKILPLSALPLILLFGVVLLSFSQPMPFHRVENESGVWDMREFDFQTYNARFGGYVEFISNALLNPEEFASREDEAVFGFTRGEMFLTSRMRILVPSDGWYTFSRPSLDYSHRLYVNGEWLLDIGSPGDSRGTDIPNTGRITFTVAAIDGVIEIVQQSSNFVHRQGGHHQDWFMGIGNTLANDARSADLQASITMGSYLVLFLLFALLFFMLGQNRATLYCALFCLMWFMRIGVTGGRVFTVLLPWLDWHAKFRIEYISIPVAAILTLAIVDVLFPKVLHKIVLRAVYIVSAGFILLYLFANTVFMSHAIIVSYAIFGIVVIYLLVRFGVKVRKVNMGQGIFLVGLLLFILSAVLDTFYFTFDGFISIPYQLTGVSMLLFVLCKATAVFMETMREVEEAKEAERRLETAEENSRAKSGFLAKMSHEIRTPMNAIIGMTELILRENLSGAAREQAVTIKHSGAHLLSLINDLLDFSKIESGKLELVNTAYLFHSTINDVVSIIKMRMTNPELRFAVYMQHDIPNELFGDEVRLRQILLNILSNALKYTKNGHFSLDVTGEKADDGETVMLTMAIRDTGIGIKPEDIKKLFSEFVQFDLEKNRNVEGTGLGLAITQNLIKLMGGEVKVSSEYGKGSEFVIRIPQKLYGQDQDSDGGALTSSFEDKSALLYGSTLVYTEYAARALKDLQVECQTVSDDNELHDKLLEGKWDYIFAEEGLAHTAQQIARTRKLDTKIVMMSDSYETKDGGDISILVMPVYYLSLVNLFSGRDSSYSMNNQQKEHFVAPDARILLVDDISTNLKVGEGLLKHYGVGLDMCASGKEAIEAVQSADYDLVLMDHMMPEMDGVEAVKIIRSLATGMDDKYANLPVIALTANAIVGAREMYLQNGFNDFLSKPIETGKLNSILAKWIPKEKQRSAVPTIEDDEPSIAIAIEDVDTARGISLSGGSSKGYLETLAIFRKDGLKKMDELSACLESGNLSLYTTYVHALKSACANIGAAKLSEEAKILEAAGIRQDMDFITENNGDFIDDLKKLLANIGEAIAVNTEKPNDEAFDVEALKNLLTKLKSALESFDMPAIDEASSELQDFTKFADVGEALNDVLQDTLVGKYKQAATKIDDLLVSFA